MVRLRAAKVGNEARAELSALAEEFPAALRELDTLTDDELLRRADLLERVAMGGAPVEPWMIWLSDYHLLMRVALRVKRRFAMNKPSPTEADTIAEREHVDAGFVHAAASPPHGRLNVVVFDALARAHGHSAAEIWDALFPRRGTQARSYR